VLTERMYLAVSSMRAPMWAEPIRVADFRGQPLVVYPKTRPDSADEVVHMCLSAGFAPTIAVEALDVVSCLAHVGIDTAVAVVPESATKTRADDVVFLPIVDAQPAKLSCIYRADSWSPTLNLLIAFLDSRTASASDPGNASDLTGAGLPPGMDGG
jgi:hypothetical protein